MTETDPQNQSLASIDPTMDRLDTYRNEFSGETSYAFSSLVWHLVFVTLFLPPPPPRLGFWSRLFQRYVPNLVSSPSSLLSFELEKIPSSKLVPLVYSLPLSASVPNSVPSTRYAAALNAEWRRRRRRRGGQEDRTNNIILLPTHEIIPKKQRKKEGSQKIVFIVLLYIICGLLYSVSIGDHCRTEQVGSKRKRSKGNSR